MYHTNKINQVSEIKKSFNLKSFSEQHSQTDHFIDNIDHYLSQCTPFEKQIASYILKYRYSPWVKLTNQTIADFIGCSVKTVTRSTNKFLKDGFITKHQSNRYAPNSYTFNDKIKKGKHTFSYWFNSLSADNQYLYNSHGIIVNNKKKVIFTYRNVPHNKSYLILDSLFRDCMSVSSRMCVKISQHNKKTNNKKKEKIVNEVQKQLIFDNRDNPRIREVINNPKIKGEIITPIIEKIATVLMLDEKEQLKLVAFTPETLEYVYKKIDEAICSKKVPHVSNRMEWLLLFATQYCAQRDMKPDWKWYYTLCDIIGVESTTPAQPLKMRPKSPTFKRPVPVPPADRRMAILKEIESCRTKLADPDKYFKFMKEESIKYTQKELECQLLELSELEGEGNTSEKQILSYQHSSGGLEAYCA